MPAERTTRTSTPGCRNRRRDSCASNHSVPDAGFRPTSPVNGFSPYGTLTPGNSRPGSPFNKPPTVRNIRKSNSSNQSFTALLVPPSPPPSKESNSSSSMDLDPDPSTITWEYATALVENQKVQTSYEKPTYSESGQILSYGKMLTKTVTMTITTTIASTEIMRPGQEGYQASLERYRQQQEQQEQQDVGNKVVPDTSREQSNQDGRKFPSSNQSQNLHCENRRHNCEHKNTNFHSPASSPPRSPMLNPAKQESS